MAAYKASSAQLRAIFALGRKLEMDTDDLHGIAYRIGGVESLKHLTAREAGHMIDELRRRAGEPVCVAHDSGGSRATGAQQRMIALLVRQLGWWDQPERLRGWLHKYTGVDDARFLTVRQAGQAIDGLKAMRDGGRAERGREA